MLNCLVIGLGGFIGAICRYLLGLIQYPGKTAFPFTTLFINFLGALLIGIITNIALKTGTNNTYLVLFLKVGICGGFTTFSTFSLETFNLLETGHMVLGFLYICLSVILCVVAVWCSKFIIS